MYEDGEARGRGHLPAPLLQNSHNTQPPGSPRGFLRLAMDEIQLLPAPTMREKVERLEEQLHQFPQVECPLKHHFAPGMYAREILIPSGTTITGAVHKTDNLVVLSQGTMRVATPDGSAEYSAPHIWTCKAGTKNAVFAVTDVVWTNFFPTDETDLDKLAELLTESRACELLGGSENKQLAANMAAHALEN